jgi:hypothetical protein
MGLPFIRASVLAITVGVCGAFWLTAPARAADDGQGNLFDSVLGIVGMGDKKADPEIDYRDRAPLVLPPKMALRQPLPAGAQRPATWPVDPDVVRRAKEAQDGKILAPLENDRLRGKPLTKQELLAGRGATPASSEPVPTSCLGSRSRDCMWVRPDVLRAQGVKKEEASVIAVGSEPERKYLVDPPAGYRKVTKEVKITQSAPIQKEDTSPLSFFKKINPWDKEED